jgi:hypothetical protein
VLRHCGPIHLTVTPVTPTHKRSGLPKPSHRASCHLSIVVDLTCARLQLLGGSTSRDPAVRSLQFEPPKKCMKQACVAGPTVPIIHLIGVNEEAHRDGARPSSLVIRNTIWIVKGPSVRSVLLDSAAHQDHQRCGTTAISSADQNTSRLLPLYPLSTVVLVFAGSAGITAHLTIHPLSQVPCDAPKSLISFNLSCSKFPIDYQITNKPVPGPRTAVFAVSGIAYLMSPIGKKKHTKPLICLPTRSSILPLFDFKILRPRRVVHGAFFPNHNPETVIDVDVDVRVTVSLADND